MASTIPLHCIAPPPAVWETGPSELYLDTRILGKPHLIDYAKTLEFFAARGDLAPRNPLTATMYQDPELARRRDEAEKQTVLPLIAPRGDDRVLDIGCGSGRWAEVLAPRTAACLGIDFTPSFLDVARERAPRALFQRMSAAALDPAALVVDPPFSLFILSGVLAYLNDADAVALFATISAIAAPESRLYLREPVAKAERLTLDEYWSGELRAAYSAVYRTAAEYTEMFAALAGFSLRHTGCPFPPSLENRAETEQRFFILGRSPA